MTWFVHLLEVRRAVLRRDGRMARMNGESPIDNNEKEQEKGNVGYHKKEMTLVAREFR